MGARARFSLSSLFPKEKVVSSWVQLSAFGADSSKEIAQRLSWEHFHLLPLFNLQSFEKVFLSNPGWKNCFDEIVFLAIILEIHIWCIYSQQLWMLSKVNHTRYQQMICWPQIPADQVAKGIKDRGSESFSIHFFTPFFPLPLLNAILLFMLPLTLPDQDQDPS